MSGNDETQNNLFVTLADITISNIFRWLLPHERLLCAKICKLFRDNVYSLVTFGDIWICHNPWIHASRFGFTQSIHYRGYNNAFLLNLLPYDIRKFNYDEYLTKHQRLQQLLTTANHGFEDDFDENEDYDKNEKCIIDHHPPETDSDYNSLQIFRHIRCLCIANDVALTLLNLSQTHQYNHVLSKNIRFLILYLPHASLCYRYHKMKQNTNQCTASAVTPTKHMRLNNMKDSIQNGLDLFTKIKYLCLVELSAYYILNLNLNKFNELIALHLYAINKTMNWTLFSHALLNQKQDNIWSNLLVLSLEHCVNLPIKLCHTLFECCDNIKHVTLIRNSFIVNEYDDNNNYLLLPPAIVSLVWFKNKNIIPVFDHCQKLYQLFMSFTELNELIPLFFGAKQNNMVIKQMWIIDQMIEIPLTDLISDDSDKEDEKENFDHHECNKQYVQRQKVQVFVRDIWVEKVQQKLANMLNCVVLPIPESWHLLNPHFTINECSFLTQLRHSTDTFLIDDVVYDGV